MGEPLLDIVMLVHDQAKWADLAIRAVEHFTKNPYRLIIVDSASQEKDTKILLDEVKERGHTVVTLAENKSFSNGVNIGVSHGSAKFIVVLNDDAIVTEGWDTALLQEAANKYTGLAGARVTGAAAGAMGDPRITEAPYLVFVCVAMRRDVWDKVGPLDEETFDGFSSEDLDYSWRILKAGLKLKVAEGCRVMHMGSRTLIQQMNKVHPDALAIQGALNANNAKYNGRLLDKWGKDWVNAHASGRPRVMIATFHAEEWTRVAFMQAFVNLKLSGFEFAFFNMTRSHIAYARNAVAKHALASGFTHLMMLDDDSQFPIDTIQRFLAHDKDIVTALAYGRKAPHMACIFEIGEDGLLGSPIEGWEHTGLRKVDVSGYHCSMIKTSVFARLKAGQKDPEGKVIVPGTENYFGGFDNKVGEDFAFSLNCKKLGIQVWCDTDLISGHIGESIVIDEKYKREFVARGGK